VSDLAVSDRTGVERFIGVDAGGSRTISVLVDEGGTELARAESGPSGFQDDGPDVAAMAILSLLTELTAASEECPARLVCAMAGGGHRAPSEELRRHLVAARIADEVAVVTDADAALHAAFGDGPGIVVIAGTGSIAVGRGPDGRTARAGGSRPPSGDPGSGEWIGRQAIQAGMVAEPGKARDTVARVARTVGELAEKGDAAAAALVRSAAEALAVLAIEVGAELGPWEQTPRIALAGGLLDPGRPVRTAVTVALERGSPGSVVLPDRVDAALGAARLALQGGFASRKEP